jgi:polyisoprenoid-binding protein YceI
MSALFSIMLTLFSTISYAQNKPLTTTYQVDPAATTVRWEGKKVTGSHHGNVSVKKGVLNFQGDLITDGEIVMDMNTIDVKDIPADSEYNAKLVGHLKNEDFFNVSTFPESMLKITGSEKTKDGLKVKGSFSMIGKTYPVEFLAKVDKTDKNAKAKAKMILDRTKWGLKYGSGDFFKGLGDKAIHNEFTLDIDLLAKK